MSGEGNSARAEGIGLAAANENTQRTVVPLRKVPRHESDKLKVVCKEFIVEGEHSPVLEAPSRVWLTGEKAVEIDPRETLDLLWSDRLAPTETAKAKINLLVIGRIGKVR